MLNIIVNYKRFKLPSRLRLLDKSRNCEPSMQQQENTYYFKRVLRRIYCSTRRHHSFLDLALEEGPLEALISHRWHIHICIR